MTSISKKQVLSYVFMPQLRSRFGELFASGFKYIPYFIALVYQVVRLLPANHPYLNPVNMGKYGIRHVIAEAANNLVVSKNNIDQLLLFFLVLVGFVLMIIQISLLCVAAITQPAVAQVFPVTFNGFFGNSDPSQDIAMIMLDMVFGVAGIFESCISAAIPCEDSSGQNIQWLLQGTQWPFPVHIATQRLFGVYSTGLLVVATLIASYFVITVIAETAQTGTPFGKRFNKVWAPIRIVVAFGLLVPISQGLNSSQFIVLYAAKYGSHFATNGWNLFNYTLNPTTTAQNNYAIGDNNAPLVTAPNAPEIGGLLQMMYTAKVCRELELARTFWDTNGPTGAVFIEPYMVKSVLDGASSGAAMLNFAYTDYDTGAVPPDLTDTTSDYTTYEDMIEFADGASFVTIRFGHRGFDADGKPLYPEEKGYVKPICGEIILPLLDPRKPRSEGGPNPAEAGAEVMQRTYWRIINLIWYWVFDQNLMEPVNYPKRHVMHHGGFPYPDTQYFRDLKATPGPTQEMAQEAINLFTRLINAALFGSDLLSAETEDVQNWLRDVTTDGAVLEQLEDPAWSFNETLKDKGWAGAAIWYNKIAQLNGALAAATYNAPIISKYPDIMEFVKEKRAKSVESMITSQLFNPAIDGGKAVTFGARKAYEMKYATALWLAYEYWQAGDHGSTSKTAMTGHAFTDMINHIFGTTGLFEMRENRNVHPLAQLVTVGRSLIQASTNAFGVAAAIGAGATFWRSVDQKNSSGAVAAMLIGPIMSVVMITLTIGFVLFYIVPFLPFIYFFFAVGGWIKGIFEAMVGAPLWALAHIRIDGNGLPGQAAASGYYLIFEIFLRPILIIFGLLASISIFSALVSVLNDTWDLVTKNLAGAKAPDGGGAGTAALNKFRGPLDQLFYTVVYAIVVYLMGMSSFKLIDLIPNNILRWIGQSTATFNDSREDAAQGLVGAAGVGGQQAIQSISGGTQGVLEGMAKGKGGGGAPQ